MTRALVIAGPTGAGKSEVALAAARLIPAEIVVVDSMQVYKGMDLGTGKPDRRAQAEVPHYGLDLAEPSEEFSVAQYLSRVLPVLSEIVARGKTPLLVAGSGLYLKALLDGLCPAPSQDSALRQELTHRGEEQGWESMHGLLKEVDPAAAEKIHPNDSRRIVRALEVHSLSKRPITSWQKETAGLLDNGWSVEIFGLFRNRALLYRRIDARVDGWMEQGWLDEAKRLRAGPLSKTAREALGYKELFLHLNGERALPETVSLIKRNTRHYAKRQMTWFRRDSRVRWLSADDLSPEETALQVAQQSGMTADV